MSDIIELDVVTKLDIPVERILRNATKANMTEVVICGFDANGEHFFASSKADAGDVLYHLEMAKLRLMNVCLNQDDEL